MSLAGFLFKIALPIALLVAIEMFGPQNPVLHVVLIGSVAVLWISVLVFGGRRRAPLPAFVPRRADSDDAVLSSLGMEVDNGDLRAACARVARRIHGDQIRVVGFV